DHVQDIFMEHCSACHDAGERSGGLDLGSFATTRAGGSSGSTLVPGDAERSRLYRLVAHLEKPTMPPDHDPIDKELVVMIREWIQGGAPENAAEARRLATERAAEAAKEAEKAKEAKEGAKDGAKDAGAPPPPMPANWPDLPAPAARLRAKTLAI